MSESGARSFKVAEQIPDGESSSQPCT